MLGTRAQAASDLGKEAVQGPSVEVLGMSIEVLSSTLMGTGLSIGILDLTSLNASLVLMDPGSAFRSRSTINGLETSLGIYVP